MVRTGRPKSDNPKNTQIGVRLDKVTLNHLDVVAKAKETTRVEVIRQGIEIQYQEIKNKDLDVVLQTVSRSLSVKH